MTAPPDRQIAAVAVVRMGMAKKAVVDGDPVARAAHQRALKRHDMLEQRDAARQVGPRFKEIR